MSETNGAATTAPIAEPVPRTDKLELLQQLSGGSIGVVHKAKNPKIDRTVALRQIQVPEWLDDVEDLLKRILAEARAASALEHPSIARLYTGGYKGFTVFLTSEFVDAPNLKEFVSSRNPNITEVLALARQLCSALDCAHEKKVLHNALTPTNIKVLPDGTLKLLDFGLLRDKNLYSPTPAKRLENEHYLSPEQLKNKPLDRAANLFSAATILYELFTTRNPFAGKHLGEVDRNITDVEPHPASMAHPRVPEAISRVLAKALSKNPQERFQSGKELAAALEEALNSSPARAPVPTVKPAGPITKSIAPVSVATGPAAAAAAKPAPVPKTVPPAPRPASATTSSMPPAPPITQAIRPAATVTKPAAVKPPTTVVRKAEPARLPAKLLAQWKWAGIIVAVLFVVSALAISLSHRSRGAAPEAAQLGFPVSVKPTKATSGPATDSSQPSEIREVQPHARREKAAKAEPAPTVPVPVADGVLSITSVPDGATIEIAGRTGDSYKTPLMASLAPAAYQVTISKAGYSTEKRSIEVQSGNRASLDVKLTALQASLTVGGTPAGARVIIDGKETGKFSPAEFTLEPASHSVTLRKEGYFDSTSEIKLTPGQAMSYAPILKPAGRTDNIKVVGSSFKKMFGGGSVAGMGHVEIKSDPKEAQIVINGTTLPRTTPVEIQLEPGNYEVTLQKEGYKPAHRSVLIQANDKLKIEEKLGK